jgi:hypothetical protein
MQLPWLSLSESHPHRCFFFTSINFFLTYHSPVVQACHSLTDTGQEPNELKISIRRALPLGLGVHLLGTFLLEVGRLLPLTKKTYQNLRA